jgi:hypothetical protein
MAPLGPVAAQADNMMQTATAQRRLNKEIISINSV